MSDSNYAVSILQDKIAETENERDEKVKQFDIRLNELRQSVSILLSAGKTGVSQLTTKVETHVKAKAKANKPPNVKAKRPYNRKHVVTPGVPAVDKVYDIIKSAGRFIHTAESDKFSEINNVSAVLSNARRRGTYGITNYRPGTASIQTVWGLAEWLGSDGKPMPQFMYNEQFLSTRK